MHGCMESFGTSNSGALNPRTWMWLGVTHYSKQNIQRDLRALRTINPLRYLQGQKGSLKHLVSNLQATHESPSLAEQKKWKDGLSQLAFTTRPISMLPSWCLWRPEDFVLLEGSDGRGWKMVEADPGRPWSPKGSRWWTFAWCFPSPWFATAVRNTTTQAAWKAMWKCSLVAKGTPTYPWSIRQASTNPQNERFFFINCWLGVWGINPWKSYELVFHGHISLSLSLSLSICVHTYKYIYDSWLAGFGGLCSL